MFWTNFMLPLKSGSHLPKKNFLILFLKKLFRDGPSKMMKNRFYFFLKALSVLKILKFMMSQPG